MNVPKKTSYCGWHEPFWLKYYDWNKVVGENKTGRVHFTDGSTDTNFAGLSQIPIYVFLCSALTFLTWVHGKTLVDGPSNISRCPKSTCCIPNVELLNVRVPTLGLFRCVRIRINLSVWIEMTTVLKVETFYLYFDVWRNIKGKVVVCLNLPFMTTALSTCSWVNTLLSLRRSKAYGLYLRAKRFFHLVWGKLFHSWRLIICETKLVIRNPSWFLYLSDSYTADLKWYVFNHFDN